MVTCSNTSRFNRKRDTDFEPHARAWITTDSGLGLQVCDAYNLGNIFVSSENLVGTSGWSEQHAEFTTFADTRLLLVRVIRPASNKLDNQIAGAVWIDDIRLISGSQ